MYFYQDGFIMARGDWLYGFKIYKLLLTVIIWNSITSYDTDKFYVESGAKPKLYTCKAFQLRSILNND